MAKFIKGIILIVAVVALFNVLYDYGKGYYDIYQEEYKGTTTTYDGDDVVVVIPAGAPVKTTARILKEKGLIQFESAFVKRVQESDYRIKEGTYTLNTGMSTLDMIKAMSPVIEVEEKIDTLVVPEGFTIEQIAVRCERQGICSAQEFLNEINSVTSEAFPYLNDVPEGANVKYKLQGYIFPATYDIYPTTTAKSLVGWMLETFENYYTLDLQARAEELGYNSYEVVTMASIIEREAKVEEERARIAGVINNRLKADMPLQMCPTVLYPLTNGLYDQSRVYYEDLELESPYNTYKYSGLPVGPICNPGIACINAVLYPEEHNYYYYHVKNVEEGTHVFTETYQEHIDTQIIGGPNGITEDMLDENGNLKEGIIENDSDDDSDNDDASEDLDFE
ncbi:MAG: endolytic transglycosylase MltG [Lachnospiraceae bacterium]|nr:endolytic transglycosylase MltG [Lachnospiraceae bacterium]